MPCENTVNPLLILYDIDSDWLCVAFQLPVGAVSLFGSSPPPLLISKKTEDEEVRVTWTVQYLVSRGFFLAWLLGFMESLGRQSPIWPRFFFFGKYLTIIGRVWTKYGDLSVVSRSIIIIYLLICETLTNHVIFGYPSSIIVLSFDHQVCFLMNVFGKRSDLPFFTQEWSQNTRHSWTTLRVSRTLFVGSYFAGHVVDFRPMKRTKNLQRMIISLVCPLKVKYHVTFLTQATQGECIKRKTLV